MGNEQQGFRRWARLEAMGHRVVAGLVSEITIAGAGFVQVQIPGIQGPDGEDAVQLYGPQSIFCITPVTEDWARQYVQGNRYFIRSYVGLPPEIDDPAADEEEQFHPDDELL